ncbi:hypothetical protein MM213_01280 [Belliella sp. R4-6]|uniref:Uncharacterized protein n=1 Tax=Belliella alkalica TaxID=1730871 RepID=A0ABS9V6Q3_9BACT|nr:hypothetical protein [Belliella alkalica]MCH7412099.1 hypothetical protein [Belliella alkalica]
MTRFKKYLNKLLGYLILILMISFDSNAQNQPNIPKPSGPIDFSKTSNIVIFIIIPIIIILAFLIFRKRIMKVKKEIKDRKEKQ